MRFDADASSDSSAAIPSINGNDPWAAVWWRHVPNDLCVSDPREDPAVMEAERSLRRFVELAWPVVEPASSFVPGWHLDAVCEHLSAVTDGRLRNLLINIPPRHMKSLAVCVFWPAWEWIAQPHRRYLFSSYALSLSQRDSVRCRRLVASPWYQARYGHRFSLRADQNTKLRFETSAGGCRLATSVGAAATGEGGDRVVVDDPHNVIHRESDARRSAALEWWDQTMSTRLNDPRRGAKVIVMQRIHERDLSGHVLEQGGYEHLRLPAEFEPQRRCVTMPTGVPLRRWLDPRQFEGELLWPARIGPREIEEFKKRLGPDGFAGQFQQRPAPAGGALFHAAWFRYYRLVHAPAAADEPQGDGATVRMEPDGAGDAVAYAFERGASAVLVRADACDRFAVMDPAASEPGPRNRPCFTVIQVWDVTPEGEMLLVHQYRRQVQAPAVAHAAADICRRFDVPYIAIEKDGIGLGIVQHVRGLGITVRAIKARGAKAARSQSAEIRMANGQILFPRGAPYLFDLEQELLQFPKGQYADQVDALAHAAHQAQRLRRTPTAEPHSGEKIDCQAT